MGPARQHGRARTGRNVNAIRRGRNVSRPTTPGLCTDALASHADACWQLPRTRTPTARRADLARAQPHCQLDSRTDAMQTPYADAATARALPPPARALTRWIHTLTRTLAARPPTRTPPARRADVSQHADTTRTPCRPAPARQHRELAPSTRERTRQAGSSRADAPGGQLAGGRAGPAARGRTRESGSADLVEIESGVVQPQRCRDAPVLAGVHVGHRRDREEEGLPGRYVDRDTR